MNMHIIGSVREGSIPLHVYIYLFIYTYKYIHTFIYTWIHTSSFLWYDQKTYAYHRKRSGGEYSSPHTYINHYILQPTWTGRGFCIVNTHGGVQKNLDFRFCGTKYWKIRNTETIWVNREIPWRFNGMERSTKQVRGEITDSSALCTPIGKTGPNIQPWLRQWTTRLSIRVRKNRENSKWGGGG